MADFAVRHANEKKFPFVIVAATPFLISNYRWQLHKSPTTPVLHQRIRILTHCLHHVIHGVQQISTHTYLVITSNSILRITDFFNPLILKCRRKVSLDSNFTVSVKESTPKAGINLQTAIET
jgi:hypothetical protein